MCTGIISYCFVKMMQSWESCGQMTGQRELKVLFCIRASITAISLNVTVKVAVNFCYVLENIPLIASQLQLCALNDATGCRHKAHTFKEEEVSWKSCAGK